jgi:diguanylate cyclase (GGDEF)-like protein/PAS domain S-box-containing protein
VARKAASIAHRRLIRWMRPHGFILRLAGCIFCETAATIFVGLAPEANLIWVANGVMLAYLLLAPRNRWPAYLCAGYAAQLTGGMLIGHHGIASAALLTFLNLNESLLSALLLRRRSVQLPDFTNPSYVARFIAFGVFAGPVAMGAVDALLSHFLHYKDSGTTFLQWVASDSLGACVATPACVAIFRTRFRGSLYSFRNWSHLIPVVACAIFAFSQARVPLPFLIYPLLVLVLLRLGLGWAALASLLVAAVGSSFTVRGRGPYAVSASISPIESAILLQLFMASAMVILYSVSVVIESLRDTKRRLQEIASLHEMVTENSRDVIIIADFEGKQSFVSAAGSDWGGWTQQELSGRSSLDLVHPEDRPKIASTVLKLRAGRDGALVECRVMKRDGSYIWVEASLRTIRDQATGIPKGILNSVREISERKCAEQKLADAYRAVESLAVTDALTGLANRRRFDQCLAAEWRRCMRDSFPLSLLLIDVDQFKPYNDRYGHLRGDHCLRQIAEVAQNTVARSGDLVARFGGEEFAVILPKTLNDAAIEIANSICGILHAQKLPHEASPAGIITVSVGCATVTPQLGENPAFLIELADQALYRAKRSGRNQVCTATPQSTTPQKQKPVSIRSTLGGKAH